MNSTIKHRILMGVIVFAVLIQFVSLVSASPTFTDTGFRYPTDNQGPYTYTGWLAGGPGMPSYFKGYYHIGQDIEANVDDTVYPISDGEIIYISVNGWNKNEGDNNYGIVVKHTLNTGENFLVVYGHVRPINTNLRYSKSGVVKSAVPVSKETAFATIGPYGSVPHLHLGILPTTKYPSTNWGMMPLNKWPNTNGFVDPINWITTKTPLNSVSPSLPTSLIQYKSDGSTGISLGDTTTENTVIMKGGVSDPGGNNVQLEVEVKPVNTEFTGTSTLLSPLVASGSTASVTYTGLSDGTYKWRARAKNSNGATGPWQDAGSNAANDPDFKVSIAQASPVTLTVSPSSGRQGATFTFNGNGYTPNGAIEYHVKKLDNTEFPAATLTASSSGVLSYSYQSTTASPVGTYTIWAIDKTTGRQSNNVQETITAAPVAPVTLAVSPTSGPQGTTFTFSGNGYTPNGAMEWHVKKPDNVEYPTATLYADASGGLKNSYTSTSSSMVGTYTIWAIDKSTGRQSNNVQETIT